MGTIAENSLWYKGKSEVLREFKKSTGQILSAVAARNFSDMPGFAIEAFTDVEIDSKFKLTEYNQKIMGDAIDRELKALGLENDIALKQATMAWETEKMQLFSDLQTEFADAELIRQLTEEEYAALIIEQELRETTVLLAKTAIEVQIEDIKRQQAEVELLPLPYEEQVIAAKLETARRKLDVIPYIMAALSAQSAALDAEETIIMPARQEKAEMDKQVADLTTTDILPLMGQKATATMDLTSRQATLIPLMLLKATASKELAAEMMAQLENHILLAAEKVKIAGDKVLRLAEELILMGKEMTLESKKLTIEKNRADLELQRAEAKLAVADALRTQLGEIKTAMTATSEAEITYINVTGANEVAVKKSYMETVEAAKYAAQLKEIENKTEMVNKEDAQEAVHNSLMISKTYNIDLKEKLVHLLG